MRINKTKEAKLTAEIVRALFDYNPIEGALIHKTGPRKGYIIGTNSSERLYTIINGESYSVSRVIWLHYYGEWPKELVDHEDENKQNNRIKNLRGSTHAQNCQNRKAVTFKGGITARAYGGFQVRITANGVRKSIGYFKTREEAITAYAKACQELHGEFANLGVK